MFRSQQIIIREYACTSLKSLNNLKLFKNLKQEFQNSGFKLLNNFKLFSNFNEVQAYFLMMIC